MKGATMLRTQALRLLGLGLLMALTASCAKQAYPTGGPKDTTAPKALEAKPQNESRHFNARQFYIQFDEYVVLKDADNNVLVSPPMAQKPEFTTKGRGVLVKIKDTLQPNTTYLFQFKEAIADFTEGNLLPSYEYVFSTGDAMDTMMLAGSVVNARSGKPWKETLSVLAFRGDTPLSPGDTAAPSPAFVTRTDKEGRFAFHYIPAGRYRLVALEDKNKNLRVDSTEAVAWDTTLLAAADSIDSAALARLLVSAPERRAQRLLKAEFTAKGRIVVSTLLPMTNPVLTGEPLEWRLNTRGDTLDIWCRDELCDSTVLVLTTDEGLRDTLRLRYRASSRRGRGASPAVKPPLMQTLCDGTKAFYDSLMLAFSAPVTAVADSLYAEVMHLKDSAVGRCHVVLSPDAMRARLDTLLRSGDEYSVRIPAGLFADLYGHLSDSLLFRLTPKDYGTLTLKVGNLTGYPLLVEVLDAKDTVVKSLGVEETEGQSATLKFTHLAAGDYRLRAVVDRNGDGRWTPGDYRLGRQPEEHFLYEKTLSLREKWEMEEHWTVGRSATPSVLLPGRLANPGVINAKTAAPLR